MDALCLNTGIQSIKASPISAAGNGELRPAGQPRNLPWGFTFRQPLRSLWPGRKGRYEPAIATDENVLVVDNQVEEDKDETSDENWVFKILHVRSLWKGEGRDDSDVKSEDEEEKEEEVEEKVCVECDSCDVEDRGERIQFDRESFSKMLKKVPLAEARLYAKMSYLGSLAYSIPQIKPGNLLRNHGLRFVTSSLEKKEILALKAEKEKLKAEKEKLLEQLDEVNQTAEANDQIEPAEEIMEVSDGKQISASAAYQMAASAASYLHSHTKSILSFNSTSSEDSKEDVNRMMGGIDMVNQDMASLMATTDSVTAVVAAKEEVKQAVADDLNSIASSPCEWFACDDDQCATRYFVIQGSESLSSWQANLLFEPVQFEGLDVSVHRGIYEAAKGIYEQMLPEIRSHLETHGERATFGFTGHSLGGSLALLVNLMLLIRGGAPRSSLLPVVTFGAPSIMCGGDRLLRHLELPKNHLRSISMHRDIVPRAFSCNYPGHVAQFLKAVNRNFRNHPCLNKQKLLYSPMGEFLILQPDSKFSPSHDLLPSGSGLYILTCPESDFAEAERQVRAAQSVFMNSPHPLEILSDRGAYGSEGTIQRDHDMNSYLKSVRNVIRQELTRIRKIRREQRKKIWWPLVAPHGINAGLIVSRHGNQGQFNFPGIVRTGKESWKRFTTLVASQHMHLLVVLLFPARLLVLGAYSLVSVH